MRVKKWTTLTRMKSQKATYPPKSTIAMMTTTVESDSSLYFLNPFSFGSQGQEAFWSSTFTSLKKFFVFVNMESVEALNNYYQYPQLNIQRPRQEGLEPPTDGFGDRYSTN